MSLKKTLTSIAALAAVSLPVALPATTYASTGSNSGGGGSLVNVSNIHVLNNNRILSNNQLCTNVGLVALLQANKCNNYGN